MFCRSTWPVRKKPGLFLSGKKRVLKHFTCMTAVWSQLEHNSCTLFYQKLIALQFVMNASVDVSNLWAVRSPHPTKSKQSFQNTELTYIVLILFLIFSVVFHFKKLRAVHKMVGIHIKEHKARFAQHDASYCEMLIYHSQLSLMVLPEDQKSAGILTHWQLQSLCSWMSSNLGVNLRWGSKFCLCSRLKDIQSCI